MGFGRKVGAFLGLVPDDQRGYGDGEEFADGYGHEQHDYARPVYADRDSAADPFQHQSEPYTPRSGRRTFGTEPVTQGSLAIKPEMAPRRDIDAASRPATVKLTGFGEARVIGEKYRDGQSVILDMTEMSDSDARRLVDFSAGLAFSLRGSIEKVAPKVFMLLPPDLEISSASAAALLGEGRAYAGR
jgi:cell division inhibitor SepF